MSKIAKALERAKEEQARRERGDQTTVASEPASEAGHPVKTPAPDYSRTRVQPVDKEYLESRRIIDPSSHIETTDLYNLLRTQVLQRTRAKGWNTLMVTSSLTREGKTTTSINLAIAIARDMKQTALLVETDLRKPDVSNYLGLRTEKGLANYLLEDVPLDELLINPGLDKLVVLPAGKPLSGSTDLLGSPRMEQLVRELKERYPDRYVIFDSLPLLNMPDALVFTSYVDSILMVVEAGRTSKKDITTALDLIRDKNVIGVVMNKAV